MKKAMTLGLILSLAAPAAAGEPASARYTFVPVEAGVLRLDSATGEVSLCGVEDEAPLCAPASEASSAPSAGGETLSRLEGRAAALEARIAALEAKEGEAAPAEEDEAMDRVMLLTERMMRRFFGIVRDMKREMGDEEL